MTSRQLATGVVLLLFFAVAAAHVAITGYLPDILRTLILFILAVFGYATLWGPANLALYDRCPYQVELRCYKHLIDAEIVV